MGHAAVLSRCQVAGTGNKLESLTARISDKTKNTVNVIRSVQIEFNIQVTQQRDPNVATKVDRSKIKFRFEK